MGRDDWIVAARQATDFIHTRLWFNDRLLATCKDDVAHLNAYLDDYAFMLDALLELMQVEYRAEDMVFAEDIAEALLEEFESDAGGFYFTGHSHETLIHRPKQGYDNATPSGNGIAATALQRLGHMIGEVRYLQATERTLKAFNGIMQRSPAGCPNLLMALEEYMKPPSLVVLRGPEAGMRQWREALDKIYSPAMLCVSLPATVTEFPTALTRNLPEKVNAWVCHGVECLPVIHDLDALIEAI